jgi:signal peptidase II
LTGTRSNRLALSAYALAVAVSAADQALKWWVLQVYDLPDRISAQVVGPFWLSWVENRGVSFGVLNLDADWTRYTRWVLSIFSIAVALSLAVWVRKVERPILAVAVGLIMGGAIGNVIDRLRFGWVADFLDFSRLWFPWVFNIADSAITVGAILLIWDLFLAPRKGAPA